MKTLIVSFYYFPEIGAAPSRISNMAEGLQHGGFDVDVLTCLPNYPKGHIFEEYRRLLYKKETINGINVYRYWTYATISKNRLARIISMLSFALAIWFFGFRFLTIRKYERVIIQSPPILVSFSAMLLFRCLYRKTTILNVSDLWPLSAVELGAIKENGEYHRLLKWIERFLYKHASAYQGQSLEIINHIDGFEYNRPSFLYRNLQPQTEIYIPQIDDRRVFKIVYAGLLGVAQDILGIVQHINFKEIGAELHIFGGGNQAQEIQKYAEDHDRGVYFHGYQPKSIVNDALGHYHASIVPLSVRIKGAVPYKIFDLLPHGTPILFAGGGEGEEIVNNYHIGFVSPPGNYHSLEENILKVKHLSNDQYMQMRNACLDASKRDFSFFYQMDRYINFIKSLS